MSALSDPEEAVRVQAVGVVGYLKLDSALPALMSATKDPAMQVRRSAVGALAFADPATVNNTLIALSDEEWPVREVAAETIGKIGLLPPVRR